MSFRALAVLLPCVAFLGARLGGLHFHVSEPVDHHQADVVHHDRDPHVFVSHATSDFSAGHFQGHAEHGEADVGADVGVMAKLSVPGLLVWLAVVWFGISLASRDVLGLALAQRWLRPPDILRWPQLLLPPSQGPPRTV